MVFSFIIVITNAGVYFEYCLDDQEVR